MNKLMGFYELKDSGLSTINWQIFNPHETTLDSQFLWTVRSAINSGNDLNLPRLVGAIAEDAYEFALSTYNRFKDTGIVIVYPYFIAEKSGTLEVNGKYITIEAVKADLWNLVTENKRDVTIYESDDNSFINGNENFLSINEYEQLKKQIPKIKSLFRDFLYEGKSILLEWSFAYNTNRKKEVVGDKYLVFYEIRSI